MKTIYGNHDEGIGVQGKVSAIDGPGCRWGELVVITKNGVPVAQLVPVSTRPKTLFGLDAGGIRVLGDIVEPVATAWEAQA